jgi:hypothetical protein
MGFEGTLSAIVQYEDDIEKLSAAGVQAVYNVYQEAGAGFAAQVCGQLDTSCGLREEKPEV